MISNYSFNLFFDSLKVVLINMVASLMMSAKLTVLGFLKIKMFQTKGYGVIFLSMTWQDLNYYYVA